MLIPESVATALAKLLEKQRRLNEVFKQLHDAMTDRSTVVGNTRYRELQAEWEVALHETGAATEELSAIISRLQEETEKRG